MYDGESTTTSTENVPNNTVYMFHAFDESPAQEFKILKTELEKVEHDTPSKVRDTNNNVHYVYIDTTAKVTYLNAHPIQTLSNENVAAMTLAKRSHLNVFWKTPHLPDEKESIYHRNWLRTVYPNKAHVSKDGQTWLYWDKGDAYIRGTVLQHQELILSNNNLPPLPTVPTTKVTLPSTNNNSFLPYATIPSRKPHLPGLNSSELILEKPKTMKPLQPTPMPSIQNTPELNLPRVPSRASTGSDFSDSGFSDYGYDSNISRGYASEKTYKTMATQTQTDRGYFSEPELRNHTLNETPKLNEIPEEPTETTVWTRLRTRVFPFPRQNHLLGAPLEANNNNHIDKYVKAKETIDRLYAKYNLQKDEQVGLNNMTTTGHSHYNELMTKVVNDNIRRLAAQQDFIDRELGPSIKTVLTDSSPIEEKVRTVSNDIQSSYHLLPWKKILLITVSLIMLIVFYKTISWGTIKQAGSYLRQAIKPHFDTPPLPPKVSNHMTANPFVDGNMTLPTLGEFLTKFKKK